jgi:hypothetical protein
VKSGMRHEKDGRPGGNRTPNLRFWRPLLCQLSYWPVTYYTGGDTPAETPSGSCTDSLKNLGDDAGADRPSTLADGEA